MSNTIKFYKKNEVQFAKIGDTEYRGYTISNLPTKFGYKFIDSDDKPGISKWFNFKGLTFIEATKSFWDDVNKQYEQDNIAMLFKVMK